MKLVLLNNLHGNMLGAEHLSYASHFLSLEKVKEMALNGELEVQFAPTHAFWKDEIEALLGVHLPNRERGKNGKMPFLQFKAKDRCIKVEKKSSFDEVNYRFYLVSFFEEKREKGLFWRARNLLA